MRLINKGRWLYSIPRPNDPRYNQQSQQSPDYTIRRPKPLSIRVSAGQIEAQELSNRERRDAIVELCEAGSSCGRAPTQLGDPRMLARPASSRLREELLFSYSGGMMCVGHVVLRTQPWKYIWGDVQHRRIVLAGAALRVARATQQVGATGVATSRAGIRR